MMCSVLEFQVVEVTKASRAATIKWPFCQIFDEVSLYSSEFGFAPANFYLDSGGFKRLAKGQ
jgi:hypothetical protein